MNSSLPPRPRQADLARIIISVCLMLAVFLAWLWLWQNRMAEPAGQMDMPGMDMSGMEGMAMAAASPLSPTPIAKAFLMWGLMMVAMMLPSAMPMILLHARLSQAASKLHHPISATSAFVLTYVAIWTAAALVAAVAQQAFIAAGYLDSHGLMLDDRIAAGGLLIVAGLYQLSPLKRRCLDRCRSPLSFLLDGWRPGIKGAVRLGLRHGFYCLGCCWLLMTLLFVGGVMNLAWVAILALIVFAEKLLPGGRAMAIFIGLLSIAAGLGVMTGRAEFPAVLHFPF